MEGKDIKQVGVIVNLDKERHLVFDLNAFCELEEKFGSIGKAMDGMKKGSMKSIRYMLWLGLLNEDESLTEREVGKLITVGNLQTIMLSVTQAITVSSPKPDEKK